MRISLSVRALRALRLALAVCTAVAGVLAYSSAPALASGTVEATTGSASSLAGTTATLGGTVNPEGELLTSCSFEYGVEVPYESTVPCSASNAAIGAGTEPVAVHVDVTGLKPGTLYHYRLVAADKNAVAEGQDATFIAPAKPAIESESAANVAATSATLRAQINPMGADTSYRFEYGTQEGVYATSAPIGGVDLGASGLTALSVSVHLQGLQAGTPYHFRVVATNKLGTASGSDQILTTAPAALISGLPDGRQYELVSPVNKHGGEAGIPGDGVVPSPQQASEDGRAFTYGMKIPPDDSASSNPIGGTQLLSTYGAEGWATQNVTPPLVESPLFIETGSEFWQFSTDLSRSVVVRPGPGNIRSSSPEAPEDIRQLPFLRSGDDTYQPMATGALAEGAFVAFEGASPDVQHVVIASESALLPGVNPGTPGVYEWSAGRLQLVSILPDGTQAEKFQAGTQQVYLGNANGNNVRHAVSDDGSRVTWTVPAEAGFSEQVYQRDMLTGQTVKVAEGEFQTASSDGLEVFTGAIGGDLDAFNAVSGVSTDLTPAGQLLGVLGASEDGSYVYFVAGGALAARATSGRPNLYVSHYDHDLGSWQQPRFITTLSKEDIADWESNKRVNVPTGETYGLSTETARVSPGGRYVAFLSRASLTDYDNLDLNSGTPDSEVYLYDSETGRLLCASCNSTGARPTGPSKVPGWTRVGIGEAQTGLSQSRYLSDEGRLFFDSSDALVAQDTNGREDVYQYEPDGVGSCGLVGGCVDLISSGAGSGDTSFVDASVSGNDVFIRTQERLVSQDIDEAFDIYDAHVCSAAVPCPASVVSVPPCASSDACKPGPTPQPAVFGSPPSATFSGAGNIAPVALRVAARPTTKLTKCKKGYVKKKSKCVKKPKAKKSTNRKGRK